MRYEAFDLPWQLRFASLEFAASWRRQGRLRGPEAGGMCGPSWLAPRAAREASYAALRCPLRHLTATDGGNAENAGAFFGLPTQSNVLLLRSKTFSHRPPSPNKKGPRKGPYFCLVEAGGIEPPSESPTSPDLHA